MQPNDQVKGLDGQASLKAGSRQPMPVIGRTERELVVRGSIDTGPTGGAVILAIEDGPIRLSRPFVIRSARSIGSDRLALEPANDLTGVLAFLAEAGSRPEVAALKAPAVPHEDLEAASAAGENVVVTSRSPLGIWLFAIASVVLAAICVVEAYRWIYLVQPRAAHVAADVITVSAPRSGRIGFETPDRDVSRGQILLGITSPTGKDVLVESPCDCTVIGYSAPVGRQVSRGNPILLLIPQGSNAYVDLDMPIEDAIRINGDWRFEATFISGETVGGSLQDIPLEPLVEPLAENARVVTSFFRLRIPVPVGADHGSVVALQIYKAPQDVVGDFVRSSIQFWQSATNGGDNV